MISDQSLYCLADRFDSLPPTFWNPSWSVSFDYLDVPGMESSGQGIWRRHLVNNFANLPDGWKIHISSNVSDAPQILDIVADICIENGVSFKHLTSTAILAAFSSKWAPRSVAGKFAVLYPPPQCVFDIAQKLHDALPQRSGPYILSDFEWSEGSSVFLRWGAFRRRTAWTPEGRRTLMITDELGTREDIRHIPANSESLPPTARDATKTFAHPPLLNFHAEITEALQITASGGVYGGTSNGYPVIVKEARGGIDVRPGQYSSTDRLKQENRTLKALEGVVGVPQLFETTEIADNIYTVMTRLEGIPLRSWVASNHPLLHGQSDPSVLAGYMKKCERISSNLHTVLASIHACNVAHRDLHPGNVLVTNDFSTSVIDFETAGDLDDLDDPPNGCPGFIFSSLSGRARDEACLDAIAHWMLNPGWTGTVHLDSETAMALVKMTRTIYGHTASAACDSIESRISSLSSAPPKFISAEGNWIESRLADVDRPVPLSPRSGRGSLARLGLASGLGGCLLAASDSARARRLPSWRKSTLNIDSDDPGLWDGWAGIAVCAHLLGDSELATEAMQRSLRTSHGCTDLSLSSGLAGIMLAALEVGDLETAFDISARIEAYFREGVHFSSPGLESGASGVARALRSLSLLSESSSNLLDVAREICEEDLRACVSSPDGMSSQIRSGRRLLPYLGTGGVGVAVALAELGAPEADWQPLAAPASWPIVLSGGISEGRSGFMAGLLWLSAATGIDVSSKVQAQRERMEGHLVRTPDGLALTGEGGARIAGDLYSGTSGWIALESALNGSDDTAWRALNLLFGGRYDK